MNGHASTFAEIAAILGLGTLLSAIGQKLRQPLIIMFLVTGVIAGPAMLGVVKSYAHIELLSHIGISLLLFVVGLKLDLKLVRTTGPVALATGVGQIVFTSAIGFLLALGIGIPWLEAAYLSVALTFSSTIIIVKLLSDKREIDSLHGQIAVGFLIVQDIAAIIALVVLTTIGGTSAGGNIGAFVMTTVGKAFLLLAGVGIAMLFLLPPLLKRLVHSLELLTLFAITWAVLLSAGCELLGFSKEVGAFLAGVSLAMPGYRDLISTRLASLRDFLLLFFFIDLGARLDWSLVGPQTGKAMFFSIFVLIGNPIIVLVIMGVMGYRRRTSFLAGLAVAQISEFSLIVSALGLSLGHITPQTMGLVTLVGVITIFASTYMILYSSKLYALLQKPLQVFEREHPWREPISAVADDFPLADVLLFGMGDFGNSLATDLRQRGKSLIVVDFHPEVLEGARASGFTALYGDLDDPEVFDALPLKRVFWILSTVPNPSLNLQLMGELKNRRFAGKIGLTATNPEESALYEECGASIVFRPYRDAAEQGADLLLNAMNILPEAPGWPLGFREVRIRPGSLYAGKAVRDIPVRSATGVSILGVSRAGKVHFDLGPDFPIFPDDRLIMVGGGDDLKRAETVLQQISGEDAPGAERLEIAEIAINGGSAHAGRTLAEAQFRRDYGVTVIGIRRAGRQIPTPGPGERLVEGDQLLVIGSRVFINQLQKTFLA